MHESRGTHPLLGGEDLHEALPDVLAVLGHGRLDQLQRPQHHERLP